MALDEVEIGTCEARRPPGNGTRVARVPKSSFAPRDDRRHEPSRRALEAMASAARRAKELDREPSPAERPVETGTCRLVARYSSSETRRWEEPARIRPADRAARAGSTARSRPRVALGAVVILVIAGAGLAFGLALHSPTRPAAARVATSGRASVPRHERRPLAAAGGAEHATNPPPQGRSRAAGQGAGNAPAAAGTGSSGPPARSSAPSAPSGGPLLSSASPAAGGPGQTVVVHGSALFSADGEVTAYFGDGAAPTSCSSQTSCTVIVPDLGAAPSTVALTVVTDAGTSNALTFSYR